MPALRRLCAATLLTLAAPVRQSGNGFVFVNPEHEEKPPGWKALYRAGQETTAALRAAAQQWLAELR